MERASLRYFSYIRTAVCWRVGEIIAEPSSFVNLCHNCFRRRLTQASGNVPHLDIVHNNPPQLGLFLHLSSVLLGLFCELPQTKSCCMIRSAISSSSYHMLSENAGGAVHADLTGVGYFNLFGQPYILRVLFQ